MNIKTSSMIAILAIAAAPLASQASEPNSNASVDECIKAFSSTYLPNYRIRDTKFTRSYASPVLELRRPRQYTIELSARGADSRTVLAEARCVVDGDGIELILESISVPTVTIEEIAAR